MVFRRFVGASRTVVSGAVEIAIELDSRSVEAEHLLLAVARGPASPASQALAGSGLDYRAVRAALEDEFEGTLAAAGVALGDFDLRATPDRARTPRWGASATVALKRANEIADVRRDRRILPGHIVLGVLKAPAGTVPRALERAGIDRTDLGERVAAALP